MNTIRMQMITQLTAEAVGILHRPVTTATQAETIEEAIDALKLALELVRGATAMPRRAADAKAKEALAAISEPKKWEMMKDGWDTNLRNAMAAQIRPAESGEPTGMVHQADGSFGLNMSIKPEEQAQKNADAVRLASVMKGPDGTAPAAQAMPEGFTPWDSSARGPHLASYPVLTGTVDVIFAGGMRSRGSVHVYHWGDAPDKDYRIVGYRVL